MKIECALPVHVYFKLDVVHEYGITNTYFM